MRSIRGRIATLLAAIWRIARLASPLAPDEAFLRAVWAAAGLVLTTGVGVLGYVLIDGFSPFDALYQTTLTLTTVGFQEVHPLSREARAFTIFLMLFGVGIALYLLAAIATLILEGELYRDVSERRQRRMIDNLTGHTIFVGAGRVGVLVAEQLVALGQTLVVIEPNTAAGQAARDHGWLVISDNAEQESVLQTAGVERAAKLYVMTGTDAVNMVCTIRARKMAPNLHITARVNEPANRDLMQEVGANEVLSAGHLIAREILAAEAASQ